MNINLSYSMNLNFLFHTLINKLKGNKSKLALFDLSKINNMLLKIPKSLEISGLASDTHHAQEANLFFALQGKSHHGLEFIQDLIDKKVSAIIYEATDAINIVAKAQQLCEHAQIPLLTLPQLNILISPLAHIFYKDILASIKLIGITGTEGKTSVAQFIAQSLEYYGNPCGYIGTNGIGRLHNLRENTHTTPDFLSLMRALSDLKNQLQATIAMPKYVVLEVTSHALDQKRIEGLEFVATVFTNLNRDHLDYHHTLEEYGAAKAKLFSAYQSSNIIINTDDIFARNILLPQIQEMLEKSNNNNDDDDDDDEKDHKQDHEHDYKQRHELAYKTNLITFGETKLTINNFPINNAHINNVHINNLSINKISNHDSKNNYKHLLIENIQCVADGLCFNLDKHMIKSKLYGHFMASNLAATASVLAALNIPIKDIYNLLEKISTVTGRMQKVIFENNQMPYPTVIIDYAHKPNALLQALIALKAHSSLGRIICVFGCGGDRDKGKRRLMGDIASKNADIVIITSDNPRTEDPLMIIQDIYAGIAPNLLNLISIEPDREKAIIQALSCAKPDDIILIAGKGHENYQIIGNIKNHFDDQEIVIKYWSKTCV
ncbi:hypothetical protein AwWohl_06770 [Gammaproteobacteria bacterium]|nr:hypothetical protein AwWohl_06770 [Gammaproteobacteria bacterium]